MNWYLLSALSFGAVVLLHPTSFCATTTNLVDLGRGAWGRMEHIDHNSWMMVVTRFHPQEPSRLELLHSSDSCRHWTRLAELREPGRKLDNGHLLRLTNGHILLTARSLVDGQSYHLPVYTSTNAGRSWQRLSNVDTIGGQTATEKKGLWEPFLFRLADGRIGVIYSSEKYPGYSQVLSQKISADGGRTWSAEHRIVEEAGDGKLRPGMGVVTRMSDGRFFLVYEVVGLGRGLVHYKISPDGVHWPAGLGTPVEGHEAAPYVITLHDGRLLLTSCQNTLSLSSDGGHTWKHLGNEPWPVTFRYTWPALYEITPGHILASRSEGAQRLRWLVVP